MDVQATGYTGIPEREDLIAIDGGSNVLKSILEIKPPDGAARTPPVLSFQRKREIEVPWSDVFADIGAGASTSVAALREYFESSWDFDVREALKVVPEKLLDGDAPLIRHLDPSAPPETARPVYQPDFDKVDEATGGVGAVVIADGFVIRHGTSGRLYLLVSARDGLTEDHFKSWDMYLKVWAEYVEGVEQVFDTESDAISCYTGFEEIDLRGAIIERTCEELRILRDYATTIRKNVSDVTDKLIGKIIETSLNSDELEALQRRALRLEMGEMDARRRLERLAFQAANLGFRLPLEPEKVINPDGETTLEPGSVYTQYQRTATWATRHVRQESYQSGWWIFRQTSTRSVAYTQQHEKIVPDYRKVDTGRDLLSEKRKELVGKGLTVFVFEQTPAGFATTDGTPLRRVMDRCRFDEGFRRRCAVVLPVYETSLFGDRVVAKYSVFIRPLPGILPTMLPRLAVEESLSYRIAWRETQLGELVSSINLAPGEEREVKTARTFKRDTTVTQSATSVFDISRSDTTDLASEMENQTRRESQESSNLQFSAKASGSFGGFSAEASASGGTTQSLQQTSQAIGKVAKKAAKSVSQQNREEITSTSTSRTEVTSTDETTATIRNVNKGRSLNLMFYRLYNKYEGGLFLEGLGFDVIPGVEVIAGSGVHESKSFSLEEPDGLMAEFAAARLPFDIGDRERQQAYEGRVLDAVQDLLDSEYVKSAKNRRKGADTSSISVGLLSYREPERFAMAAKSRGTSGPSRMTELRGALRAPIIDSDTPMVPQNLLVAAPGLYMDAVVGTRPATEPYSEEMRAQEVRKSAAEVFRTAAEGQYSLAQAQRISQIGNGGNPTGNVLTGVYTLDDGSLLILGFSQPLPAGNWVVCVDGSSVEGGAIPEQQLLRSTVVLKFNRTGKQKNADWIGAPDLMRRVSVRDTTTEDEIGPA